MSEEVYTSVSETQYTIKQALTEACKAARINGVLYKGGKQSIRMLKNGQACLVILSKDQESKIASIIGHYASVNGIPVVNVEDKHELGRIVGIERINTEGRVRNSGCGVAVIENFDVKTRASMFIESELTKLK